MRTLAALGAVLVLTPASLAVASTHASVRVTSTTPLRVVGSRWHARERVRVVVRTANGPVTRRTIAGTGGRFTVTFPGVSVDVCGMGLEIVAAGATGDRVVVKTVPRECPPSP